MMPATQRVYRDRPTFWQHGWHLVEATGRWHHYHVDPLGDALVRRSGLMRFVRTCDSVEVERPYSGSAGLMGPWIVAEARESFCCWCWWAVQHYEALPVCTSIAGPGQGYRWDRRAVIEVPVERRATGRRSRRRR